MDDPFTGDEFVGRTFKNLAYSEQVIEGKRFEACRFVDCALQGAAFITCTFYDCVFEGTDASLITVRGSAFRDTTFTRSKVMGVNWTQGIWPTQGLLNSVHFAGSVLNHSSFFGLAIRGIAIIDCVAHDVDFAEADMAEAVCTGTDFTDSRFRETNLTEATFVGASGYAIDVRVNTVTKARFALPEAVALLHGLDIVLEEG
ncbi:MAG: pentapeptide repeat-containing protein [Anaerolineae bacterium]